MVILTIRKILVWFQFVISLGLLVCTGIVYDQLTYLQDKDLGFTKEDPVVRFTLNNNADAKNGWYSKKKCFKVRKLLPLPLPPLHQV
ncbi:MAG: hypothetical protein R3C61_20315 [Bacteroidia bacterium]